MGWWLVLAVLLYLACAALIIAEVFVPSGGLISISALACLIGGVAIFFNHSLTAGWIGIVVSLTEYSRKRGSAKVLHLHLQYAGRARRYPIHPDYRSYSVQLVLF